MPFFGLLLLLKIYDIDRMQRRRAVKVGPPMAGRRHLFPHALQCRKVEVGNGQAGCLTVAFGEDLFGGPRRFRQGTFYKCRTKTPCLAPRIDNDGVSITAPRLVVLSHLRCRKDKALRFNGPGAQQHFPVRFTGTWRLDESEKKNKKGGDGVLNHDQPWHKRAGHQNGFGAGSPQTIIHRRKPHIVADGQPQLPQRRVVQQRQAVARPGKRRLAERAVGRAHIEEVGLVE